MTFDFDSVKDRKIQVDFEVIYDVFNARNCEKTLYNKKIDSEYFDSKPLTIAQIDTVLIPPNKEFNIDYSKSIVRSMNIKNLLVSRIKQLSYSKSSELMKLALIALLHPDLPDFCKETDMQKFEQDFKEYIATECPYNKFIELAYITGCIERTGLFEREQSVLNFAKIITNIFTHSPFLAKSFIRSSDSHPFEFATFPKEHYISENEYVVFEEKLETYRFTFRNSYLFYVDRDPIYSFMGKIVADVIVPITFKNVNLVIFGG